jgi:guanosine-3',5'-bis(diphosphate) 3'-pyrophosphohydrolase
MTPEDTLFIQKAMDFANAKHRGQTRKTVAIPYVSHVFEVYKLLYNLGVREVALLVAALLHDTIEDCGVTYEEILAEFGKDVAQYVLEMTISKEEKKDKLAYFFKFKNKAAGTLLLKLADRYANSKDWERDGRPNYAGQYAFEIAPLFYYFKKEQSKIIESYGDEAAKGFRKLISELFELYMNSFDAVDRRSK